jgi:hypothetical protein
LLGLHGAEWGRSVHPLFERSCYGACVTVL